MIWLPQTTDNLTYFVQSPGIRGNKNRLYFRCSIAANSVVGALMWRVINLIDAFMGHHVNCKNEEDPFKNEGARVVTKISHCKSMQIFNDAQGQLSPQS